ncbi:CD5 antigen-like [Argopecten irradians]|uniref:CD5 antigen-like n=1 Tax=Argopecten irradians TaxID=31199 RepID=UPI00371A97EE
MKMILVVLFVSTTIVCTPCVYANVEKPNQTEEDTSPIIDSIPPGSVALETKTLDGRRSGYYQNQHHHHSDYYEHSDFHSHTSQHYIPDIIIDYSHNDCMLCPKLINMCVHLFGGSECDITTRKCHPFLHRRWDNYGDNFYEIDISDTNGRSAWAALSTAMWDCRDTLQSLSLSSQLPGLVPGYLAVQHLNMWGHVCADNWTPHNSMVVCRMIGHSHIDSSHVRHFHHYHPGHCLMSGLHCSGHEDHLAYCSFDGFSSVHCPSGHIIGVQCNHQDTPSPPTPVARITTTTTTSTQKTTTPPRQSLKVRLVDGPSPLEGRVEVLYNGTWGTVCDDSWDDDDAKVVCTMLGYGNAVAVHTSKARYGSGVGPIWLDETQCTGQETNLGQCIMEPYGRGDCDHSEDAGVICQKDTLKVRLVDGPSPLEGRVEVLYNGTWGTVCDDSWDDDDAKVVCTMLGQSSAVAVHMSKARYGSGVGPIWLDETQCTGQETNLGQCTMEPYGRGDCDHSEDAGVICQQVATSSQTTTTGSWIVFG